MAGSGHYAYHGAFGHSTVTASVSSERGSWSASTSTHLELSYNEALFVHNVMSGKIEINGQHIQLGLGKALNVLNAGNAEYNTNGWDGNSNILSYDALKKII